MKIPMILSRGSDGKYLLTRACPERRIIRGTGGKQELYVPYDDKEGDDIGLRFICHDFVRKAGLKGLRRFQAVEVEVEINETGKPFTISRKESTHAKT